MKCGSLVFDEMTREQAAQILGVPLSASADAVRSAYKELVQVWHPDRFATGPESLKQRAHSQMVLLNEAYQCLNLRTTGVKEESAQGEASSPGQSDQNSRSEETKNSYGSQVPSPYFFPAEKFFIGALLFLLLFVLLIYPRYANQEADRLSRPAAPEERAPTSQRVVFVKGFGLMRVPAGLQGADLEKYVSQAVDKSSGANRPR